MRVKGYYLCFKIASIVISLLVSFLIAIEAPQLLVLVISLTLPIIMSLNDIFKLKRQWLNYNRLVSLIEKERRDYQLKANDYEDSTDPFKLYYNRIEGIVKLEEQIKFKLIESIPDEQVSKNEEAI
jgi:hypothetical protein